VTEYFLIQAVLEDLWMQLEKEKGRVISLVQTWGEKRLAEKKSFTTRIEDAPFRALLEKKKKKKRLRK